VRRQLTFVVLDQNHDSLHQESRRAHTSYIWRFPRHGRDLLGAPTRFRRSATRPELPRKFVRSLRRFRRRSLSTSTVVLVTRHRLQSSQTCSRTRCVSRPTSGTAEQASRAVLQKLPRALLNKLPDRRPLASLRIARRRLRRRSSAPSTVSKNASCASRATRRITRSSLVQSEIA
jgi:hypothetical protein